MILEKIHTFIDPDSGQCFAGGTLYRAGDRCMLFEPGGHCIFLDNMLADELKRGRIPSELRRPLQSRGFSQHADCLCTGCHQIRPEFFMIDLTDRCNMKCRYCLRDVQSAGHSMPQDILREICRYITDYCNQNHLKDISVQAWGGEPLLELDSVLKLTEWIRPERTHVHFSLETNATLLTQEIIDCLYAHKIGIGISIDGNQACHDQQRVFVSGQPTHQLVVRNLRLVQEKYKHRVGTITTVTRMNFQHIEEILEFFAVDLGLTNVKLNFVHQSCFVACSDMCLTEKEIADTELRILNKLVELSRRGYSMMEKNIATKIRNLLFRQYSDICLSSGCCGGRKMIVFDRNGGIFPCELTDFPNERIGSIFDEDRDLIAVIRRAESKRDYFIPKHAEVCDDCPWYCFCGGGCTVRVKNCGKNPPAIDEIECAVNSALYPALVELALTQPDMINHMLNENALVF